MNPNRSAMNKATSRALLAMREHDLENGRKHAQNAIKYCHRLQKEGKARPSEVGCIENLADRAGIEFESVGWVVEHRPSDAELNLFCSIVEEDMSDEYFYAYCKPDDIVTWSTGWDGSVVFDLYDEGYEGMVERTLESPDTIQDLLKHGFTREYSGGKVILHRRHKDAS